MALISSAIGCADKPAKSLGWSVDFACDSDRQAADTLALEVRRGDCSGDSVYSLTLVRGDTPSGLRSLAPGNYGLAATASVSATGATIAQGCVEAKLPADTAPVITLSSAACVAALVDAGEADDASSEDDASELDAADGDGGGEGDDAAVDASEDSGDAELDSGPPPVCPPDCSDTDPCTDDYCELGTCVHEPFTGLRECDRIACTAGDQCIYGVCTPGTATNSLCPDDGNPCTLETCVAGTGCNRTAADSGDCSDGISCTGTDTCRAGICRGVDACPNGVCSAGQDACISGCTTPVDCDDNNPCTIDTCSSSGSCLHNPGSGAACDDRRSCTDNDLCNAGVCAGVSTCPPGATCAGSACLCPANTALCTDACVNLDTSATHCGACDRDCGTGKTCQNGACRPTASGAATCTAQRFGGHDYLFCTDARAWASARDKCRGFGYGLAIVDSATENGFVQSNLLDVNAWIGANDLGNDGNNCKLVPTTTGEGHWYWASATQPANNGSALCTYSTAAPAGCVVAPGQYQNWSSGEPSNNGCDGFTCIIACLQGEDCAYVNAGNGTWNDDNCATNRNYVCETP